MRNGTALAVITVSSALVTLAPLTLELVLLFAIGAICLAPVLFRTLRGEFDIFEPVTIFALAYGTFYCLAPAAMYIDSEFIPDLAVDFGMRDTSAPMLVALLCGAVGFMAGYISPFGNQLVRYLPEPRPWSGSSIGAFGLLLVLLAVALFGAFVVRAGGVASLMDFLGGRTPAQRLLLRDESSYLSGAPLLLIPAALLLATAGARGGQGSRAVPMIAAVIPAALLLAWAVPTGRRSLILLLLIPLVAIYYLRRGTRPNPATVAVGLMMLLLVLVGLGVARPQRSRAESGFSAALLSGIAAPLDATTTMLGSGDVSMAAYVAVAIELTPATVRHQWGAAVFGDLAVRPIPRPLWPDKPLPAKDRLVRSAWPEAFAAGRANPAFPPMAMLYVDFSWPGILLGMFAYGVAFRAPYEYFRRHSQDPMIQTLYASLLFMFVLLLKTDLVAIVAQSAFVQAPIVAALIIGGAFPLMPRRADPSGFRKDVNLG